MCVGLDNQALLEAFGEQRQQQQVDETTAMCMVRHMVCEIASLVPEEQLGERHMRDKTKFCHTAAEKWMALDRPEDAEVGRLCCVFASGSGRSALRLPLTLCQHTPPADLPGPRRAVRRPNSQVPVCIL
jgi:hypothetical protein